MLGSLHLFECFLAWSSLHYLDTPQCLYISSSFMQVAHMIFWACAEAIDGCHLWACRHSMYAGFWRIVQLMCVGLAWTDASSSYRLLDGQTWHGFVASLLSIPNTRTPNEQHAVFIYCHSYCQLLYVIDVLVVFCIVCTNIVYEVFLLHACVEKWQSWIGPLHQTFSKS